PHNKTPYELLHGRTPSIGFMRPFGCPVIILNTLDSLGKYDGKNTDGDAACDEKEPEFEGRKPEFEGWKPEYEVNFSPSSITQSNKHDDKTKREAKGKSPVESLTRYRNLSVEFEDFSDNSINKDNAAGTLVPTIRQISTNSTNTFSVVGPSTSAVSPTHGKSSYMDSFQLPDDPNIPELEDITYSDDEDNVGAEADFNNLERSIIVSPIPAIRVHKDHPVTQIIGDLSSATQTRSMTWVAKDQGVNIPRCDEDRLELMELIVFLLPSNEKVRIKNTVVVKKVNDVTRLQALVDKKRVIIMEATIRDALRLNDAKGIKSLPNKEIFAELARICYDKPSTKLTFYKVFFSNQWKFLIQTILQCMSAKRTSWNEFSSSMASAVICLSTETPLFEGIIVEQPVGEGADEVHDEGVPAIVPNDEDDVYTEATPLARKVPVVDYEIYNENNKPYYKIKRADGSHQLYLARCTSSNLEKSKKRLWSIEGQRLEAVRVLWCADYHIYYNTVDFAGREEISTYKVHSESTDQ
nr:ribonuclease H-like domain-containing protein [Tanacetum cinerariifolium]